MIVPLGTGSDTSLCLDIIDAFYAPCIKLMGVGNDLRQQWQYSIGIQSFPRLGAASDHRARRCAPDCGRNTE
jgi:hypothetical protein